VPFRARLLRSWRNPRSEETQSCPLRSATTRRDTVTGTPGSIVERRSSPRTEGAFGSHLKETVVKSVDAFGSHVHYNFAGCRRAAVSVCERKQKLGKKLPVSAYVPHLVDLPYADLYIPERGRIMCGPTRPLKRLDRVVLKGQVYKNRQYEAANAVYLKNVNHTLTFETVPVSNWIFAFNENCKAFGPIARNRHFRFYLKLITFFGLSKKDLRNVLRVRELWIRGSKRFRKAIQSLNFAFKDEFRKFIKSLPAKARRRTADPQTRSF
jgi:hypothetical protein